MPRSYFGSVMAARLSSPVTLEPVALIAITAPSTFDANQTAAHRAISKYLNHWRRRDHVARSVSSAETGANGPYMSRNRDGVANSGAAKCRRHIGFLRKG